jgi:hypothetical protein
MRLTEDGLGIAEAIRVYVYRKRLVKGRKKVSGALQDARG